MLKYYIINMTPLSQRPKVKHTQTNKKQFISSRSRRKLIHDPYISTKC